MLLKTKGNENDNLTYPTISMKTKGLFFLSHDMYERKGTWLKPQVENGDRSARPTPLALGFAKRLKMSKLPARIGCLAKTCGLAILAMI
jgi:hypothetical protein